MIDAPHAKWKPRAKGASGFAGRRVIDTISIVTTSYIAVGANIGDREANIRRAIEALRATPHVAVTRVSTLIDNPAVGGPLGSPSFLNGVVELRTSLDPHALLARLLDIERALGRERREKWGPRTIDLDLLLFGDLVLNDPGLTLPHPRMHERRFVLEPLCEIAPDVVHPAQHKSVRQLLEALALRTSYTTRATPQPD